LEESVNGLLAQVDSVTKEKTSGTFVSYDGTPIAW
jgi:norsolorinic acid ketoreductase